MSQAYHERMHDDELLHREFEYEGYLCELFVYNDNAAHVKFGLRGMFGWVWVCDDAGIATQLAYSITVPMNDPDLNPRYIEFALLGKLEMFARSKKTP